MPPRNCLLKEQAFMLHCTHVITDFVILSLHETEILATNGAKAIVCKSFLLFILIFHLLLLKIVFLKQILKFFTPPSQSHPKSILWANHTLHLPPQVY